jgi:hypothetical protein
MTEPRITIIDDGQPSQAPARIEGATAWVELPGRGPVELGELAGRLGRPVAVDVDERAVYLGVPAAERARRLASLEAPDFALPDLDGRRHTLAGQRGKKVLLVAWASW